MYITQYTICLSDSEEQELKRLICGHKTPQKFVRRARIILLRAQGQTRGRIAAQVGVQPKVVTSWAQRWHETAGQELSVQERLDDRPRPGAPETFTPEQVCRMLAVACEFPTVYDRPISHWTPRELADEVIKQGIVTSISVRHMGRILRQYELRPHMSHFWLNGGPDERKDEKIGDICDVYQEALALAEQGDGT